MDAGLSSREAADRLDDQGPNEPATGAHSRWRDVAPLLANPLAIVLLVSSVVSAAVGEVVDAALIFGLVTLSVGIDAAQTWRSRRAADKLRDRIAPTATVRRDGEWRELPRRELVVGDLIRLSAGDLVPADARLLESRDLHVHQAALTGESLPVEKDAAAIEDEVKRTVLLGTSVVSGTAIATVTATGCRTQFGDVVARLSERPPETEFERGLRRFGLLITRTVSALVVALVVTSLAMHRPFVDSLLFAVALAVGLTPEFLPMITSVTLAQGASRMARQHVIVKHLSAIQNLGSMDVLCSDKTGTLTAGVVQLSGSYDSAGAASQTPLELARVNSRLQTGIQSPLDAAILGASSPATDGEWQKLDEIPFDFERRRVSIVAERHGERVLVAKGAPDGILLLCNGTREERAQRDAWLAAQGAMGMRILAVATRPIEGGAAWTARDEHDFTLAGFLVFSDPPLSDAADAVDALRRDGVNVKILTGDDRAVTLHVAAAVGLDTSRSLLGADIEALSDVALRDVVESTTIFARTTPAQKLRVLTALRAKGHVVGFMGDGINDAPSLHAADVGIAAPHAVDVAREAADVLITETGLGVLHGGVLAGRRAFGNVTKYLMMGTSSNFGNVLSMAAASLFLPFLPMLPTQILLNNLLYDLSQLTIPSDRVDASWLRVPHRSDIDQVRRFMVSIGPISSVFDFLTFFVLLHVFHAGAEVFHTGWFVESLATQTLVLLVIRTQEAPWRSRPSGPLLASVFVVVAVGAVLPMIAPVAKLLGFAPLPAGYAAFVAAATVAYLGLVEIAKRVLARRRPAADQDPVGPVVAPSPAGTVVR